MGGGETVQFWAHIQYDIFLDLMCANSKYPYLRIFQKSLLNCLYLSTIINKLFVNLDQKHIGLI